MNRRVLSLAVGAIALAALTGAGHAQDAKPMTAQQAEKAKIASGVIAVGRADQDQLAFESHSKAAAAYEKGFYGDLVVPFRSGFVRLRAEESLRIVKAAQRRFRRHNAARRWVEGEIWSAMAAGWRDGDLHPSEVREGVRSLPEVRIALERMWPVLTPAQLLHDLFGSKALLRLAAERFLAEDEYLALHRPRAADVADVRWTDHDVALLDEARHILGPRPPRKGGPVDEALRALGLERDIVTIVGGFSGALALARASDLIATVPERHTGNLREGMHSFALPLAVPDITVSLLWHPRTDADPAHRWLRRCVREVCSEQLAGVAE